MRTLISVALIRLSLAILDVAELVAPTSAITPKVPLPVDGDEDWADFLRGAVG